MVPLSTYQTSVVAYLDILGMKEAVRRSIEKPELANELKSMLLELQSECVKLNKRQQWGPQIPNLKARSFSDGIILTCVPLVKTTPLSQTMP